MCPLIRVSIISVQGPDEADMSISMDQVGTLRVPVFQNTARVYPAVIGGSTQLHLSDASVSRTVVGIRITTVTVHTRKNRKCECPVWDWPGHERIQDDIGLYLGAAGR
jgi:GTPase SAR1 family protein